MIAVNECKYSALSVTDGLILFNKLAMTNVWIALIIRYKRFIKSNTSSYPAARLECEQSGSSYDLAILDYFMSN